MVFEKKIFFVSIFFTLVPPYLKIDFFENVPIDPKTFLIDSEPLKTTKKQKNFGFWQENNVLDDFFIFIGMNIPSVRTFLFLIQLP